MKNQLKSNCLLFPRLDVSFKEGAVPIERGPIPEIRLHWLNFRDRLIEYHKNKKIEFEIIEHPLWKMDLNFVKSIASEYDYVFMPHKQKIDFDAGDNVLYYMQTVFPEYFTIDKKGWGGNLSYLPFDLNNLENEEIIFSKKLFRRIADSRIQNNISKFNQPNYKQFDLGQNYWLFICQIPHDETIKYHSEISVKDALLETIKASKKLYKKLIVKGHPVNPGSMTELIEVCRSNNVEYVDNYSIHQLIAFSDIVFLVNSGVGIETILHEKRLFRFGESEYSFIQKVKDHEEILNNMYRFNRKDMIENYQKFIYKFISTSYNTNDLNSFLKLERILSFT